MLRILLMVLNGAAVGFLIYALLRIYQQPASDSKKWMVLVAGIILLLLPVTMIFGFVRPTVVYLVVYPIGIFFFVYLFRHPEIN